MKRPHLHCSTQYPMVLIRPIRFLLFHLSPCQNRDVESKVDTEINQEQLIPMMNSFGVAPMLDKIPFFPPNESNSADIRFSDFNSAVHFLRLRLLGKSWNMAVLQYVYNSLLIMKAINARKLVIMWKTPAFMTSTFRLSNLGLTNIHYVADCVTVGGHQLPSFNYHYTRDVALYDISGLMIPIDVVEDLITLCGKTLLSLRLGFFAAMGFSAGMISGLGRVRGLEVLIIDGSRMRNTINDCNSLRKFLSSCPTLRSLSIQCASLDSLTVQNDCLPNLCHLWVECDRKNVDAITEFCRTGGMHINFLECLTPDGTEQSGQLIMALKDSIEILFFNCISDDLPIDICTFTFPRLRVIRCSGWKSFKYNLFWLQGGLFDEMELLITDYSNGSKYWRKALKRADIHTVRKPTKFKYIVFTTWHGCEEEDAELVRLCADFGIKCLFRHVLTYKQLLDYKFFFGDILVSGCCNQDLVRVDGTYDLQDLYIADVNSFMIATCVRR
ncbi:uncharacterized protein MELLADRAFT_105275 [Melampsora larici-populina 98AG31]|uniref:F-box domain-containing protein n=1 Tax=Melampsora larici-populina (strain 98AG31 / pathotype 3-4-7) TaxID=747676 RepID=F4RHK5_MELLP|nr:uncharacterized protein MELLADRAFT_105275 [Melampsora larici-populina 98AG31]EGG08256.1 hypothetical protein MELLADRAFT_105275 [Melampsora larici-populina 98AG31]